MPIQKLEGVGDGRKRKIEFRNGGGGLGCSEWKGGKSFLRDDPCISVLSGAGVVGCKSPPPPPPNSPL